MNRHHISHNAFALAFMVARALITHRRSCYARNWRGDLAVALVCFNVLRP